MTSLLNGNVEKLMKLYLDHVLFFYRSKFAEWIAHLHHQPCHVVYTDYRPTPLQHYIYPAGGDGLHLVVDEQGNFREENFNTAMASLLSVGDNSKGLYQSDKKSL